MTAMEAERLAEIREMVRRVDPARGEWMTEPERVCVELLDEVDRLTRQLIVRTDQRDTLAEAQRRTETTLRRDLGEVIADCQHHAHRQAGGPEVRAHAGEWVRMQDVLRRILRTVAEGAPFWHEGGPEREAYDARMEEIQADRRRDRP